MRILIADHNTESLAHLCRQLTADHHEVLPATTSFQALGIAFRKAPELIVYDFEMPQADPYDFCKLIRLNPTTQEIPMLIISAVPERIDIQMIQKFGKIEIIEKPFNISTLILRIRTYETIHASFPPTVKSS